MGQRNEHSLECAGSKIDSMIEHGSEIFLELFDICRLYIFEIYYRSVSKITAHY